MGRGLEVLSPAGDFEKLEMAVAYGADAVYLSGKTYGMRSGTDNFTLEQLPVAIAYCHERGVPVYVACNTIPNDEEMAALPELLTVLDDAGADAIILADLGVLNCCKRYAPHAAIHISTQAGVMNSETARAFYDLGASRAILAREMSIEQIAELRAHVPADLELEVFVHGAMCVSFSGRCTLSNYLTGRRDANRGQCVQPCRWKYHIVEERRPGQYFEITEDDGTYILNSRDMCMIEHIPDLLAAGATSLKIEGRTKSAYYAAVVTNAYHHAVEAALDGQPLDPRWVDEVYKVSHRPYSTGFYYGMPGQYVPDDCYFSESDVMAVVESCAEDGTAILTQRNKFYPGDDLELLMPGGLPIPFTAQEIRDEEGNAVESTNHAKMILRMDLPAYAPAGSFLRKARTTSRSGHAVETSRL